MYRKKAEQAAAREQVQGARGAGIDVDGSNGTGRVGTEDNSNV